MISPADARAILYCIDPARLARAAWRAATPDRSAAVGLDLESGDLAVLTWPAGATAPPADGVVVLALCPAHRRADARRGLASGVGVAPSEEVVEETVVRHDAADGVWWPGVEGQLSRAGRAA